MLKQIVSEHSGEMGLVLFFISFIAITCYALTRTRKEIENWSVLPLNDSGEAMERVKAENLHE